jgi:hypothetical protein
LLDACLVAIVARLVDLGLAVFPAQEAGERQEANKPVIEGAAASLTL